MKKKKKKTFAPENHNTGKFNDAPHTQHISIHQSKQASMYDL